MQKEQGALGALSAFLSLYEITSQKCLVIWEKVWYTIFKESEYLGGDSLESDTVHLLN